MKNCPIEKRTIDYNNLKDNCNYGLLTRKEKIKLLSYLKEYTLKTRSHLNLKEGTSFGIELEFLLPDGNNFFNSIMKIERYNEWFQELFDNEEYEFDPILCDFMINNGWRIYVDAETDGEFVSPIFHDEQFDYLEIEKICKKLKEEGAEKKNRAFLQISLGGQLFEQSHEKLKNALKMYATFEDILYYFGKGKDKKYVKAVEEYARPVASSFLKIENFIPYIERDWNYYHENPVELELYALKTNGVNLCDLDLSSEERNKNRIELRMMNATYDGEYIQNSINTFAKFLEKTQVVTLLTEAFQKKYEKSMKIKRETPIKDSLYDEENFEKALEFCDVAFDNHLDKLNFLKQYLKETDYEKEEKKLTYSYKTTQ